MASSREQLEADLREAEQEQQGLDARLQRKPGLDEGGAGAVLREVTLARRQMVIGRIEGLREALHRVRGGTYGRCERCGTQINEERLKILPATSLCVECARSADESPSS